MANIPCYFPPNPLRLACHQAECIVFEIFYTAAHTDTGTGHYNPIIQKMNNVENTLWTEKKGICPLLSFTMRILCLK